MRPALLSVQKIWDRAPHCSMTDLIRYKDRWYCAFREGNHHFTGVKGALRILTSRDGVKWETAAYFAMPEVDLRDPKLSITPSGQLLLLTGGTVRDLENKYLSTQSYVAFSEDGENWSDFQKVLAPHEWLWRITWYQGKAYGVSYRRSVLHDRKAEWLITLWESSDALNWREVIQWDIQGHPSETTLRFFRSGTMAALVRRDGDLVDKAYFGTSDPPYTAWLWKPLPYYVGGPNFIIGPEDSLWAAGRYLQFTPYGEVEKTFVGTLDFQTLNRLVILPSGGDCSYPGLVYHENTLWVSYYSSHEETTAIYLARLAL